MLKNAKKASPLKFASSPGKRRRQWTVAEDTALVQFIALHQEYLPADKCWPSFGSKNAYWKEAANYINQSLNSPVPRSGDTIVLLGLINANCIYSSSQLMTQGKCV